MDETTVLPSSVGSVTSFRRLSSLSKYFYLDPSFDVSLSKSSSEIGGLSHGLFPNGSTLVSDLYGSNFSLPAQPGLFAEQSSFSFLRNYFTERALYAFQNMSGGMEFNGVDFTSSNFLHTQMMGSTFIRANFTEAEFLYTDFTDADLSHADFSKAYLYHVNFSGANLTGAYFEGSIIDGLNLEDAFRYVDDKKVPVTLESLGHCSL